MSLGTAISAAATWPVKRQPLFYPQKSLMSPNLAYHASLRTLSSKRLTAPSTRCRIRVCTRDLRAMKKEEAKIAQRYGAACSDAGVRACAMWLAYTCYYCCLTSLRQPRLICSLCFSAEGGGETPAAACGTAQTSCLPASCLLWDSFACAHLPTSLISICLHLQDGVQGIQTW